MRHSSGTPTDWDEEHQLPETVTEVLSAPVSPELWLSQMRESPLYSYLLSKGPLYTGTVIPHFNTSGTSSRSIILFKIPVSQRITYLPPVAGVHPLDYRSRCFLLLQSSNGILNFFKGEGYIKNVFFIF